MEKEIVLTGREEVGLTLTHGTPLDYAENRDQNPCHLFHGGGDDPLAPSRFKWFSGKPTYISMADGIQIADIMCLLAESFRQMGKAVPYIVIAGKHGSPCGAAISYESRIEAIRKALGGDAVAVMGGEVVTNFPIGEIEARALMNPNHDIGRAVWGLDLVLAPDFSVIAGEILGKREKRKLLSNPALGGASMAQHQWVYRQLRNDWLRQASPKFVLTFDQVESWSGEKMNERDFVNVLIAFVCCWRSPSNTVALAKNDSLIALGAGQQDRMACVRLCLAKANFAGHDTRGSFFASDGFFPYAQNRDGLSIIEEEKYQELVMKIPAMISSGASADPEEFIRVMSRASAMMARLDRREGPQLLVDAGCIGGVVPGDGKELENVKQYFSSNNLSVAFLPKEHRGFFKH